MSIDIDSQLKEEGVAVVVDAVVVAYLPDLAMLEALLVALAPQVRHTYLVDNSPRDHPGLSGWLAASGMRDVSLIPMGGNKGIAAALNAGIRAAMKTGATHVLLSDQDSLPARDMVGRLLQALDHLAQSGVRAGAIGPSFIDSHTGMTLPFQAEVPGKYFYGHVRPGPTMPIVEALTLITSGVLIPVEVFASAGMMREDFFIDHVDIEWCLRARSKGWRMYGTSLATMRHRMGDACLAVWYFGWRRESAYGPLRIYYRIRNFMALCQEPWIPPRWKVRNAWYWLGFVYSHVLFGDEKRRALQMATRGFIDGLKGRMGPYARH